MAGLSCARPSAPRLTRRGVAVFIAVLSLLVCGGLLASAPVAAQQLQFPQRPAPPPKSKIAMERAKAGQKQMLVQGREIN